MGPPLDRLTRELSLTDEAAMAVLKPDDISIKDKKAKIDFSWKF